MAVFNSLGSNYNLKFVARSLFKSNKSSDLLKLKKLLEEKYSGKAFLTYKGRQALTLALEILKLPKDSYVAINGFTCVAVFNAIRKAGLEPHCLDLEETGGLNFIAKTLSEGIKKNKKIKCVVVQNTLGYPCDISAIQKICQKNNLILIEDLAHCIGTKYGNGGETGTIGDIAVLSFSQDKIIDAISGGALIIRSKKYQREVFLPQISRNAPALKDRLYPFFSYTIRIFYNFGLGKPYHFLLKKFNLLTDIMNPFFYDFYSLPNWVAGLVLYQFSLLDRQLSHRRKISEIYASELPESIFMFNRKKTQVAVSLSSNLRFPIFIGNNRSKLLEKLKKHKVFLSDIWYTDVAPECPNSVFDSRIILNLPTHINISVKSAKMISSLINEWIKLE